MCKLCLDKKKSEKKKKEEKEDNSLRKTLEFSRTSSVPTLSLINIRAAVDVLAKKKKLKLKKAPHNYLLIAKGKWQRYSKNKDKNHQSYYHQYRTNIMGPLI